MTALHEYLPKTGVWTKKAPQSEHGVGVCLMTAESLERQRDLPLAAVASASLLSFLSSFCFFAGTVANRLTKRVSCVALGEPGYITPLTIW